MQGPWGNPGGRPGLCLSEMKLGPLEGRRDYVGKSNILFTLQLTIAGCQGAVTEWREQT